MKIELVEGGKAPQRMTNGAVGFDVFARAIRLHCRQGFYRGEDGQVIPSEVKPIAAKIHLGFKIDCNEVHEALYSEQETADGGYIANWTAPMTFAAMLLPRSGWGRDYGFRLKNTVGIIDPDYRGEVIMEAVFDECPPELLDFTKSLEVVSSDFDPPRVGQMLLVPAYVGELQVVEKLDDTERGAGGFGSTGS